MIDSLLYIIQNSMQPLHGLCHSEIMFQKVVSHINGSQLPPFDRMALPNVGSCFLKTESELQSAASMISLVVTPLSAAVLVDAPLVEWALNIAVSAEGACPVHVAAHCVYRTQ